MKTPPVKTKPRLRGVSHELAFYVSLAAGLWLVSSARPGASTWAAAVYALCLATMLGVSALYHRPMWTPRARARMRRLDHAAIFLMISGTATPVLLLGMPEGAARLPLALVWAGAGFGIVKSVVWVHAPRVLSTVLFVALGLASAPFFPQMAAVVETRGLVLLVAGGVAYIAGAVIYASRRPDPLPLVFGYHEIFHVLVIVAAACHFVVVRALVAG